MLQSMMRKTEGKGRRGVTRMGGTDGLQLQQVARTEGVEVTAIGAADTAVAAFDSAIVALAANLAVDIARVRGVSSGNGVGLPNVQLIAASTVATRSCVDVVV
jgi:hypothetical protein